MFELTNEQRKCFCLLPVDAAWKKVIVKPSPYDDFITYAYLEGHRVRKVILVNDAENENFRYSELEIDAVLSEDETKLLPKTDKGKEKLFSSSNLLKYTATGMALQYNKKYLSLTNYTGYRDFFHSGYDDPHICNLESFRAWVEEWCRNTGEKELVELKAFANAGRIHQKYREGDFFRYRINRKLYGYGRILLDFEQMRKKKIPFWDIFMGKPLCAAVYHIVTERADVTPDELIGLPLMPSHMIVDDAFFYGEYQIIGNAPLTEAERDYPIHYGKTIQMGAKGVRYQCGKTYIILEDAQALDNRFRNNGIGWHLKVKLPVLEKCIEAHSNQPYWDMYLQGIVDADLRNPKYSDILQRIKTQVGII